MTEQAIPVGPDKAPLRLEFEPSSELIETILMLVKPEFQQKFGEKALHVVARDIYLPISPHRRQFAADQELIIANYLVRVRGLDKRQFPMRPGVAFKRDDKKNLYVGMWMAVTAAERTTILSEPFDGQRPKIDTEMPSIGVAVRIPEVAVLPDLFLDQAEADVESAFGMRHPSTRRSGRANNRLHVSGLDVHSLPGDVGQSRPKGE